MPLTVAMLIAWKRQAMTAQVVPHLHQIPAPNLTTCQVHWLNAKPTLLYSTLLALKMETTLLLHSELCNLRPNNANLVSDNVRELLMLTEFATGAESYV
jgi:hypothetical protein